MARERWCYREGLPFGAMVTMECVKVGLKTLFKAATNEGMSYHVFIVYSYALAALLLLPSSVFFINRSNSGLEEIPPLNFSILSKIILLGFVGFVGIEMGYRGITYSSPTLASAISNLVPAFTFILAVIFRMEKFGLKNWSCRAKVLGTIVSISGAFVVTFYKGPKLIQTSSASSSSNRASSLQNPHSVLSSQSNWALGGLLLSVDYLLTPMWYIILNQIMKEYPAELTVVWFYNLSVSIMAAIAGIFTEPDLKKWRIRPDIALASMICSGILGSGLNNAVDTWVMHLKGPVYVAMFKPLSVAIAVAMGIIFLGDTLYLGSILGAIVIALGFYSMIWGKAKEEELEEEDCNDYSALESSATNQKCRK